MKAQVLLVSTPEGLDRLGERLGGLSLHRCVEVDDAVDRLAADPPRVVVLAEDLGNGQVFQLLTRLDALAVRIPVLIEAREIHQVTLPEPPSPYLQLVPPGRSTDDWMTTLMRALDRTASAGAGPMFHLLDFLLLAVRLDLSLSLECTFRSGVQARCAIWAGDLRAVQVGAQSGFSALGGLLFDSPLAVTTARLGEASPDRERVGPKSLALAVAAALAHEDLTPQSGLVAGAAAGAAAASLFAAEPSDLVAASPAPASFPRSPESAALPLPPPPDLA